MPCSRLLLSPPSPTLESSGHLPYEAPGCTNEILCTCQDTRGFVSNPSVSLAAFSVSEGSITGMMPRPLSQVLDLLLGRVHQHAHSTVATLSQACSWTEEVVAFLHPKYLCKGANFTQQTLISLRT